VLPDGLSAEINLGAWRAPPVFDWLAKTARLDAHEMLRTFNCGIGMIVVADAARAGEIASRLTEAGEAVFEIGRLAARDDAAADRVRYAGALEFGR
jgi:phosphoribosylformylglycinamidine cyclo-ligase